MNLNWQFLAWWFWAIAMMNIVYIHRKNRGVRLAYPVSATALGLLVAWIFS
jgi:hypothetical protein